MEDTEEDSSFIPKNYTTLTSHELQPEQCLVSLYFRLRYVDFTKGWIYWIYKDTAIKSLSWQIKSISMAEMQSDHCTCTAQDVFDRVVFYKLLK